MPRLLAVVLHLALKLLRQLAAFFTECSRGGGTIRIKAENFATANYSYEIVTNAAEKSIQYVDLPWIEGGSGRLALVTGPTAGPVWIPGALFLNEEASTGVVFVKAATGGKKASDFVAQDASSFSQILAGCEVNLTAICLGMNDRSTRTAAQILTDIQSIVGRCGSSDVLLMSPQQPSDYATTSLPALQSLLWDYAKTGRYAYINIERLYGSYADSVDRGYMLDGVHGNARGNSLTSMGIGRYTGLPYSAPLTAVPGYGGGGGAGATVTLWTIGLINGTPLAVIDLSVCINRTGTSSARMKRYAIRVSGGTVVGQVVSVGSVVAIDNIAVSTPGDSNTGDCNITAAIVSNRLVISAVESASPSVSITISASATVVLPYNPTAGQAVYEY